MTLKIFVYDYLTKSVEIDTTIQIKPDMEVVEANHDAYRKAFPNCQVNFVVDENNFIFAPPLNQEKDEQAYDEGRMSWNEYVSKWHGGGALLESDDDMPDHEVERQIDDLMDANYEDFAHSEFYSQTL
jgi:hypothetical protein